MLMLWIALILVLLILVGQLGQAEKTGQTPSEPTTPIQLLAHARTCRPDCPACREESHRSEPPPRPTSRVKQKPGRPRQVDTDWHYCPVEGCSHYGWVGLGNIVANGHPNHGRWRQLHCTVCGGYFMETSGTIFYRSSLPPETLGRIIKGLAEGWQLHSIARVFEVEPDTVQSCLVKAAAHMDAVSNYLIHDLHLSQVQVDELWALVQSWGQETNEAAASPSVRSSRPHAWVWAGIDPNSKLLLATVVGDRSLSYAQLLIHAIMLTLAPGVVPLFLSDQLAHYATALLTHFGHWVEGPRRSSHGPAPRPRWAPLPELNYAQVVKHRVKGRVVKVTQRVVFGCAETIRATLSRAGHRINTAFIERVNLTLRAHIPALARKVLSFAKTPSGLAAQVSLSRTYYNFCLPHHALRLPLPAPLPTKGHGSPKLWQGRTPAMAAGVTRHIWSMPDLLLFRVPPWRQEVSG